MIDWTGPHAAKPNAHHNKDHKTRHQSGGADEIDITGLTGGYGLAALKTDHPTLTGSELHDPKTHGAAQHTDVARELFISPGYSTSGLSSYGPYSITNLMDAADEEVGFSFKVPDDFVSLTSVHVVMDSDNTGNMYNGYEGANSANGETMHAHQGSIDPRAEAVVSGKMTELPDISSVLVSLAKGDYTGVYLTRYATDPTDTLGTNVRVYGLIVKYIGEQ